MRSSKHAILARFHKTPRVRFKDQQPTSFGGLIVLQALLQRLELAARLQRCFPHLKSTTHSRAGLLQRWG